MKNDKSRREFLNNALGGAVGITLLGGANFAEAQTRRSNPKVNSSGAVVVRRDISTMKPDDEQLLMFKEAVRVMKRRSEKNPLDPGGWMVHAAHHAIFCATQDYNIQVHYNWLFLPWHRAYLWNLEKNMQTVIGEPKLALPYWDWTRSPRIPAAFWGDDNPLNNVTRLQRGQDELPADFLDVAPILRASNFKFFGGFPKTPEPSDQIEGIVEQGVHNNTHNWIGGDMAGFSSAGSDALFSTHHGNLDRLWEAWLKIDKTHKNPAEREWLDTVFTFYKPDGNVRRVSVKDLVDTKSVGYTYDSLDFRMTLPTRNHAALWNSSDTNKAQIVKVAMNHHRHMEMTMALAGGGRRVVLQFERAQVPVHPLCIRAFFNQPDANRNTDVNTPFYAGTFTFLPIGSPKAGLETLVTLQMEVSSEVAEILHKQRDISISLVPVPLRGRVLPETTLQIKAAKLKFADE